MANTNLIKDSYKIDIVKHRDIWLGLTAVFLIPCIIAIIFLSITQSNHAPLKLGIDFTGGKILQYSVDKKLENSDVSKIRDSVQKAGINKPVVQITTQVSSDESVKNLISLRTSFIGDAQGQETVQKATTALNTDIGKCELVSVNSVGPTLGAELLKNTLIAITIAFILMVVYISFRFQVEYGWIALMTVIIDTLFVVGVFAIRGIFFDVVIDSLFVTAILTIIGYSINDTIVVFDRIRENMRFLAKKHSSNDIINASINQTLARSINTSATTLFTLLALYLFGGSTIKEFVLAIIVGVIAGTFCSIFVAGTTLAIVKEKMAQKNA